MLEKKFRIKKKIKLETIDKIFRFFKVVNYTVKGTFTLLIFKKSIFFLRKNVPYYHRNTALKF